MRKPRGSNPNGEGSIYRRQDGRWVGAAYAPTNRGGRKRIAFYGRTRTEVREKLTALLRDVDRGLTVAAENWTVEQYLNHWLSSVVKPNRAPRTYQGYELVVRRHLVPVLGRKRLKALGVADVRRLVQALTDSGLGVRTTQQVHAVLRNALEQAVRDEAVARNVAKLVKVKTPTYEVGRGLTVVQAKSLLHAVAGERLQALYVLAVYLGLRRAEVLGLRRDDIDLDAARLQVTQTLQRVEGKPPAATTQDTSLQADGSPPSAVCRGAPSAPSTAGPRAPGAGPGLDRLRTGLYDHHRHAYRAGQPSPVLGQGPCSHWRSACPIPRPPSHVREPAPGRRNAATCGARDRRPQRDRRDHDDLRPCITGREADGHASAGGAVGLRRVAVSVAAKVPQTE